MSPSPPLTVIQTYQMNLRCARCQKDGFSSLDRINKRSKTKCPLEWCSNMPYQRCGTSRHNSAQHSDSEGTVSDSEFVRHKKERSTVLVRRYLKNNRKVVKTVCPGTRDIARILPPGRMSEIMCQKDCRRMSPLSEMCTIAACCKYDQVLQAIQLQVSRALLTYPRVRLAKVRLFALYSKAACSVNGSFVDRGKLRCFELL